MSKIAYVFPGQGAQAVGMGKDLYDNFNEAKEVFEKANTALGFDIKALCFDGPIEELKKTAITQPAIFTMSIAAYAILKSKGKKPSLVAGHSLGEYSAICAAQGLSFEDAVRLLHLRGKFMQEAVPEGQGAMAAVLGLSSQVIVEVCKTASSVGPVEAANFNSPDQTVISGSKEGVEEAAKLLKEKGAKRVIPLQVSAPFHCSLMKPAADKLAIELNKTRFNNVIFPLVANVLASEVSEGNKIRNLLIEQVTSSVRWTESVIHMTNAGVSTFVEIGPGKVLSGLIKKISPSAMVYNVEDVKSLEGVLTI